MANTPLDEFTDELFKQAFLDARIRDLEAIKLAMPEEITCSRRHMRAMKRIIRGKSPHISRSKRMLILVAALLALLAGCSAYIKRNELASFIEELFDDHARVTAYTSEGTAPKTVEIPYTLTYVPEGYEAAEEEINIVIVKRYWRNADGKEIYFEQNIIQSTGYIDINIEQNNYQLLMFGNNQVYFRNIDGQQTYLWTDNLYLYQLRIDEKFSNETLTSLFEGIQPSS